MRNYPLLLSLATILLAPLVAFGQEPVAAEAASIPNSLKILVLEGQRGYNVAKPGQTSLAVVEVRDADNRLLSGVSVTFRVPITGPAALFEAGASSFATKTNTQGQAAVTYRANEKLGRFNILVTARSGNLVGTGVIEQTNVANEVALQDGLKKSKSSHFKRHWKTYVVVIALAAGGAIGGILATRNSGSSSSPTVVIVNPGTVGIGGPPR